MPCGTLIGIRNRPAVVTIMRVGHIPEITIGNVTAKVSACRLYTATAISNVIIIEYATIKPCIFALAAQVCKGIIFKHDTRSNLSAACSCAEKPNVLRREIAAAVEIKCRRHTATIAPCNLRRSGRLRPPWGWPLEIQMRVWRGCNRTGENVIPIGFQLENRIGELSARRICGDYLTYSCVQIPFSTIRKVAHNIHNVRLCKQRNRQHCHYKE